MNPLRVGVIGCGNISNIYLTNLLKYEATTVTAVADIDADRARAKGEEFQVKSLTVDEILGSSDVDLILNLTVPKAHYDIALKALQAGKHAYNEKPLALERAQGKELVDLAKAKNLRLGCAPDTFLGGGIQTCIGLIDGGVLGKIVSAQAFMMGHGVEAWHPSPHFFYQKGGGPMFDMGPYYLTALVTLIGGIERVTGVAKKTFATRTVTSEPHKGDVIEVEIPTHVSGLLEFKNGAVAELTTSFDVWHHTLPPITIHGTEGSLRVGDPNQFGDIVHLRKSGDPEWSVVEPTHGYTENSRGLGVLDIAFAIQNSRPHRASGDLAFHVLDTMHAIHESSDQGRRLDLESSVDRPAALPPTGLSS